MPALNPVLPGFNPDPSFLRVDEDYYIATSTFEWFPGVCIHHSKDMVNWEIAAYALTDDSRLDMTGLDPSCGIWAPNLTWDGERFYLAYTIVYTNRSRFKDTWNFIVTAPDVRGPWSEPVPVSRSGFDPSVFHDDDGKKYLVNMTLDHRPDKTRFSGIDVQEYDPVARRLVGEPRRIFRGTRFGTTEGPNIIKKDGWYYLTMAEGGTGFLHCATVVRSRSIWGPYEESPLNPLVTSEGQADCALARAGHAQIIEGADGKWYMAHLCARPLDDCSILGRETAIQNLTWTEDGWPKLAANDEAKPESSFIPPIEAEQKLDHSQRLDFAVDDLPLDYMTLRRSREHSGVSVRDGALVIAGGCSPMCRYEQGLVAHRQRSLNCDFTACMRFVPRHLNHLAGLLVYYNCDNFYYLKMTRDEEGLCLAVSSDINGDLRDSAPARLPEGTDTIYLKAEIRGRALALLYSLDGSSFTVVEEGLDMRCISDEHVEGNGFTGSMLGVNCCDCQGDGVEARFTVLDYQELV